jgi:hypothetical protein
MFVGLDKCDVSKVIARKFFENKSFERTTVSSYCELKRQHIMLLPTILLLLPVIVVISQYV